MTFGLTTAGFVPKRQEDIIGELNTAAQAKYGVEVDLDPRRPIGQMLGIVSERLASLWALAESLYSSMSPLTAGGQSLDQAVALTGITRLAATSSLVTLTVTGVAGTTVPVGFQVQKVGDTSAVFEVNAEGIIGGGGTVDVTAVATETGAKEAPAGTVTEIVTPVSGIASVTNAADASAGRDRETDSELKIRQQDFLQAPGTSTVKGIRAAIILLDTVEEVIVVENKTGVVDGDGRPPKSFETVVQGGDLDEIAETIWAAKPVGIETYGDITRQVTDSQGVEHDILFSRPTEIEITITATLTTNSDPLEDEIYPVDGDDLVEAAILEYADTLRIGRDVFLSKIYSYINEVPGIVGIALSASKSGGPTVTDSIAIAVDELAVFDSARITVNS